MPTNPAPAAPVKKAKEAEPNATVGKVKTMFEDYIKDRPLEAAIQAAAAGYALRFLSIRSVLSLAAKLAVPGLFVVGAWKACEYFEPEKEK